MAKALAIATNLHERSASQRVMVSRYSGFSERRRFLRIFRDAQGLYVVVGRRTSRSKRYLADMSAARIIDAYFGIVVFYEE